MKNTIYLTSGDKHIIQDSKSLSELLGSDKLFIFIEDKNTGDVTYINKAHIVWVKEEEE